MADVPLIKAAKLWAKVSQRTGAVYLTGRWGGCRVLVFENLERASEAEPSHFLFLGEAVDVLRSGENRNTPQSILSFLLFEGAWLALVTPVQLPPAFWT